MNIRSAFQTAIDLRARMVDRLQEIEPVQRKVRESIALFLVLAAVYSFSLHGLWSNLNGACSSLRSNFGFDFAFGLTLLKFLVLTGWPFALLANLDATWTGKDAGRVFLAAFISTNVFWMHLNHYRPCPFAIGFLMFPYVFSAVVGNFIGSLGTSRTAPEEYPLCREGKWGL